MLKLSYTKHFYRLKQAAIIYHSRAYAYEYYIDDRLRKKLRTLKTDTI